MKPIFKFFVVVGSIGAAAGIGYLIYKKVSKQSGIPETDNKSKDKNIPFKDPSKNKITAVPPRDLPKVDPVVPTPPPAVVPPTLSAKEKLWKDSVDSAYASVKSRFLGTGDQHNPINGTLLSDVEKASLKDMFEGTFFYQHPEYRDQRIQMSVDQHKDLPAIILSDAFFFLPSYKLS